MRRQYTVTQTLSCVSVLAQYTRLTVALHKQGGWPYSALRQMKIFRLIKAQTILAVPVESAPTPLVFPPITFEPLKICARAFAFPR